MTGGLFSEASQLNNQTAARVRVISGQNVFNIFAAAYLMKTQLSQIRQMFLLVTGLALVAGCHAESSATSQPDPLAFQPAPNVIQDLPDTVAAPPPSFTPSPNLAEVIKLIQSGVDESVVRSYINNTPGAFSLGTDGLIYLKDLGVSKDLVLAMMQHDQPGATLPQSPATPTPDNSAAVAAAPQPIVVEPAPVTVDYFYDALAPYGTWVDLEGYGRCWQPTVVVVQPTWQPYCDRGHWVYSDYGWYWVSDYSWGNWAFHYGRWFRHPQRGWCWTPDTVWSPAWVSWRSSGDYCGWAPLPPAARYRPGVGFFFNDRAVGVDFEFGLDASFYTFVPLGHFNDRHPHQHFVPRHEATQIFNLTTIHNDFAAGDRHNTVINRGFAPAAVAAATHTEIRPQHIRVRTASPPAPQPARLDNRNDRVNNNRVNIDRNTNVRGERPGGGNAFQPAAPTAPVPARQQPDRPYSGRSDAVTSPTPARSVPTLPVNEPQHTPRIPPTEVNEHPVTPLPANQNPGRNRQFNSVTEPTRNVTATENRVRDHGDTIRTVTPTTPGNDNIRRQPANVWPNHPVATPITTPVIPPTTVRPQPVVSPVVTPSMPVRSQPVERPSYQAPVSVHSQERSSYQPPVSVRPQTAAPPPTAAPSSPNRGTSDGTSKDKRNDRDH